MVRRTDDVNARAGELIAGRLSQLLDDKAVVGLAGTFEEALNRGFTAEALESKLRRKARAETGRLQRRRSRTTGTTILVVVAKTAGYCDEAGPFATVCEDHSEICNHRTETVARRHAARPDGWCEACRVSLERDS